MEVPLMVLPVQVRKYKYYLGNRDGLTVSIMGTGRV